MADAATSAAAAAASAAPSSAVPAAAAAAATPSALDAASMHRESRFYVRPPGEFLDDVVNAVGDYVGYASDEFEKLIVQQILRPMPKTSTADAAQQRADVGRAVDAMYQSIMARLTDLAPEFEAHTLEQLRIPAHVVVSSELNSDEMMSHARLEAEEEAALRAEVRALQQRVANAAKLNGALRQSLAAHQQDEETYAEYEEHFVHQSKTETAAGAARLEQLAGVVAQVDALRPTHAAVVEQYANIHGKEASDALPSNQSLSAQQPALTDDASQGQQAAATS